MLIPISVAIRVALTLLWIVIDLTKGYHLGIPCLPLAFITFPMFAYTVELGNRGLWADLDKLEEIDPSIRVYNRAVSSQQTHHPSNVFIIGWWRSSETMCSEKSPVSSFSFNRRSLSRLHLGHFSIPWKQVLWNTAYVLSSPHCQHCICDK